MRTGSKIVEGLLILTFSAPAFAEEKVLHCGQLWDGTGRVLSNATIVIEDDSILTVSTAHQSVPAGAEEIDLSRFTVIPGLIDVHTHMTYFWNSTLSSGPLHQEQDPTANVEFAQENARKTLENGVTTVRDLNADDDMDITMRDFINSGEMIGPRMFVSGSGLYSTTGPPSPEQMKAWAEQRIVKGKDWVKVFASTGSFADVSGEQTISFEAIKAAVNATHAMGKRIAVHSYGPDAARDAVRAGADSIEHAVDLDDETLEEMARKGIVYVPTIDHNRYYLENRDLYDISHRSADEMNAFIARNLETARRAHQLGVRIAMGSDAVYTMFGQNTRELEWFVKAGMTPKQALTSATVIGAELLGLENRLGKIQPEFIADLVAVKGDPLSDITALQTGVCWVMKDGTVVVDKR